MPSSISVRKIDKLDRFVAMPLGFDLDGFVVCVVGTTQRQNNVACRDCIRIFVTVALEQRCFWTSPTSILQSAALVLRCCFFLSCAEHSRCELV